MKITSIRKQQLIWLTVVKLIISDSFVAKDHVWNASSTFNYSFFSGSNHVRHNIYTSTAPSGFGGPSNRKGDNTDSSHQICQVFYTYKIYEVRVRGI